MEDCFVQDMAEHCGVIKYFEVSAKTGDGVKAVFETVSYYEKVVNRDPPAPELEPAPTATRNENISVT